MPENDVFWRDCTEHIVVDSFQGTHNKITVGLAKQMPPRDHFIRFDYDDSDSPTILYFGEEVGLVLLRMLADTLSKRSSNYMKALDELDKLED